ncbi:MULTISPECIES: hypothetical protein, partial [unclassified Microcoleus]|uniref:hypothetical protein n=1 Tax=unclassified Microcoleus TaxID=2642155 RepID=UPI002FD283F4
MYQRRRDELKAIARELGIEPVGDRRKIETWELAIELAAQSMGISVEAACCPVLRAIELLAENFSGVERVQESIELLAENCLCVEPVGTVETVSLESMCFWAPCDELLLFSAIVPTAEKSFRYLRQIVSVAEKFFRYLGTIVLTAENNCLCGQALASQC